MSKVFKLNLLLFGMVLGLFFSIVPQNKLLGQVHKPDSGFPVKPDLFLDGFGGCEGIAFNGEGRMFVSGTKALWEIMPDGSKRKITELFSNLGVTAIGEKDLLVADFGPTNAFQNDRNSDGIIWRISPEGVKKQVVSGIGDPNFIWVRKDGKLLISDDATNEIFIADLEGNLKLFTTSVNHPNGIALTSDESTMYVAQIFESIRPVIPDNQVWKIDLKEGKPVRGAKLLVRTGPGGANDGLAMDKLGRLYIAANGEGKIWRYDPSKEEMTLICEGIFGAASIAFGEGKFDPLSIYVTTTMAAGRGGKIWKVNVGVEGASLNK